MSLVFRTGVFLGFLGLLLAVIRQSAPDSFADVLSNLASLVEAQANLTREEERSEKLNHDHQRLVARMAAKNRVAADLAAGRLTLLEAAACFRDLPPPPVAFHDGAKSASPEEKWCRDAIAWTEVVLAEDPARAAEVAARLEQELQDILRRDGKVCLPARAPD
jgi:hypothetical protein